MNRLIPAAFVRTFKAPRPFVAQGATRDPRLELIRGALLALLLCLLFVPLAQFNGTTAEQSMAGRDSLKVPLQMLEATFVLLTALVAGCVFGGTLRLHGFARCVGHMWHRAFQYYLAFTAVAVAVALARLAPGVRTHLLTRYTDPATGLTGSLYPAIDDRVAHQLFELVFLQAGPRQLQVLALCAVLLLLAPFVLWLLSRCSITRLAALLVASVLLALATTGDGSHAQAASTTLLGLQFERFFPLCLWQLPCVTGLMAGWHQPVLAGWALKHRTTVLPAGLLCGLAIAAASGLASSAGLQGVASASSTAIVLLVTGPGALFLLACQVLLTPSWSAVRAAAGPVLMPFGQTPLAAWLLGAASMALLHQWPSAPALAPLAALAGISIALWALAIQLHPQGAPHLQTWTTQRKTP